MFNKHFSKNRVVCEIMWEDTVELDRTHVTVWRMNIQFWLTVATDTHSEYVILCFSTATMVTRTHLSVILHIQCLSC